jgi:hypothetical protein
MSNKASLRCQRDIELCRSTVQLYQICHWFVNT